MNIKAFVIIVLCLHHVNWTRCKRNQIKDIAAFSYEIIMLGVDVIDKLESGDDFGKVQKSINDLQESMNELHKKLDDNTELVNKLICSVNELPHKTVFLQNIENIESCTTDLKNVLKNPLADSLREQFKKCYDIKKSVRGIGKYLTGQATIDSRTIYEFTCKADGLNKGQNIERRFNYLYNYYIEGCTVLVTAERMTSNNNLTILRDECWKTIGDINSSRNIYYETRIKKSCSLFHKQAYELLNQLKTINISSVHDVLQRNFPWFQFIVVESKDLASTVKNNGNFFLNVTTFAVGEKIFHVFRTDYFVFFDKNRSNENQTFINVTIPFCNYEDLSYEMNLSEDTSRKKKLVSVFGYTSDQTIDNCTYLQGSEASSSALATEIPLTAPILIFVAFMLYCFTVMD